MKSVSDGYLMKKDPEQAVKYREKGNSHFKAADYKVATLHYSQVMSEIHIYFFIKVIKCSN